MTSILRNDTHAGSPTSFELSWLEMAAEQPREAARLILAAAETGMSRAQMLLGQILLDGHGIQRDPSLALQWFRLAAEKGEVEALNMVGRCLQNGWGCSIDLVAAAACYQQAAARGYDWGQYNYANMLARGWGVAVDLPAALNGYVLAAQQGHAKAMNLVGRFHEEGWVVEADAAVAFDWYRRSAQGGDFRGQCSYASMLVGQGRVAEAVDWLRRAMHSATPAFLQQMIEVLGASPHLPLHAVADEMREHLAASSKAA